jgi:predicted permease
MVVLNTRLESNADSNYPISYLELQDWQAGVRSFDGMAGFTDATMNVADEAHTPERLQGAYVSGNTFSLIGQRPALGRGIHAEDDRVGADPVVILSDSVWRRRYASDPTVIGQSIRVNGVSSTVIGVMPSAFGFPNDAAIWQPLALLPEAVRNRREDRSVLVLGRMAAGVTLEHALADVTSAAADLRAQSSDRTENLIPKIRTFREFFLGSESSTLFVLMLTAVGSVLLIACANVANLLLARSASRATEISIRLAIGARRGRVVRQLLLECTLLAVVASALGLALSSAGVRLFGRAIANTGAPYWFDFSLDAPVFVFMACVCASTVVCCGLVPALQTTRPHIAEVLRDGSRGSSGSRNGRWAGGLVIAQFALTLPVLMTAALTLRELIALREMDIGMETSGVTLLNLDLARSKYTSSEALGAFYRQLDERLGAMREMSATYASDAPHRGGATRELTVDGAGTDSLPSGRSVTQLAIGPRYFEVVGARLTRGHEFTAVDGPRVAIVNERLTALLFQDRDPIGRRVRMEATQAGQDASEWLTIVGVASNIRQRSTGLQQFDPVIYVPYSARPLSFATILARSSLDTGAVAARLRADITALDPDLPLFDVRTLDASLAFDRWPTRVFGTMFSAFAAMALLLAAIGLYGVTAYSISQRRREIGIRAALGARAGQMVWTVMRRAAGQVVAGLLLGIGGAVAMGRALQRLPMSVQGTDVLALVGICAMLVLVATAACLVPTRRAIRLNPVDALRLE